MTVECFSEDGVASLPVYLVGKGGIDDARLDADVRRWIGETGFRGSAGEVMLLPDNKGALAGAILGTGDDKPGTPFITAHLARKLPEGNWHLATDAGDDGTLALGFALGHYRFDRYRKADRHAPRLVCPTSADRSQVERIAAACYLTRDLVNTPVNDMGPVELEAGLRALAKTYGASVEATIGDELLAKNFPMIHTVGRASVAPPRLLDLQWGRDDAPKVTLVGKGVCFDTGGLDIKPAAGMLLMKKDMGGAAHVMGLASMIMDARLPVRLRVLIPAVENAISGNAFRPSDILTSRKGLTVEIGNTDAEGRLVLADAMALADEEEPELMIDMATLTGAARVALGPDLPPFYCTSDSFASALLDAAENVHDPVWRMPLFDPYDRNLSSSVADLNNAPAGGMAGSVIAALFLRRFVEKAKEWAHFDIYAWNPKEKPHAPVGGEAQAIRALYEMLSRRFPA
ncbi:leucyl aminopeptidase family protein [Hoeflea prorocentri]|uniref:Leucyl aminopeptidase family protein n=1 Tax=Hoeflea prorocentri TaxID=1922333 RepID=A0A9X3ZJ03_9HYPH|nr:leucyl aminopeptidase family protein [Hoeflea prorocentri]MCY6382964.1 leucyl aminopeptidase family protein [Hoeflea prorocentri]MDA5400764.1 leucyl aminopeptidase family protein [Hoeflea prorocentri]